MKAIVITNEGAEDIASLEIKELVNCPILKKEKNVVFFDADYNDIAKIAYMAQSIKRVMLLLCEFGIGTLEDTLKNLKKNLPTIDFKGEKIRVECIRKGIHDFRSIDFEPLCGKLIKKKVDYDNPDLYFLAFINDTKGYFGLDFSGFDLSKRQYKIFNHPESLNGSIGYVLVRESGYTKQKTLLDPFMGSGIIPIEAALFASGFPVQYYNKDKLAFTKYDFVDFKFKEPVVKELKIYGFDSQMRFLKATEKNAKIAGIFKSLNLSKVEIEWLDTKFDKNSIDVIVTDPPRMSKNKDEKGMRRLYTEFFYQGDYILKKDGRIVLLIKEEELIKECAEKHNFKLIKKYDIYQGQELFYVSVFERC